MNDSPDIAEMRKAPAPDPIWTRVSVIWIVPLIALAITLGVAWKTYSGRGELIQIDFADATGINPGETVLKFREVTVGTVETVGFTPDLNSVRVEVRVDKKVVPYIDKDARFWLVRPEVSAQGISRLDTVLSGTFIEGWWDADPGERQTEFTGLERPPVAPDPSRGTVVELSADDAGGLAEGAPILYRGLTVGRLQNLRLNSTGTGVVIDAFINKPYDARMSGVTRFWNTSGISFSVGPNGVNLSMRSLATIVQGGVEFDTFSSGGGVVENGQVFRLFADEGSARASIFGSDLVNPPHYVLLFDEAVNGLEKGAKVQFRGVEAGEVSDLSIRVTDTGNGEKHAQQQVIIALSPERLGLDRNADATEVTDFLETQVEQGLRARIAGTGLFGTTLIVELTDVAAPSDTGMNLQDTPYPSIPTAPATQNDVAASARDVFGRINALPIEDLMHAAIRTMDSISAIADSQETREVPRNLSAVLEQVQALVASLNSEDAAQKAMTAIDGLSTAATNFISEIQGLDQTLSSAGKAADALAAMPLEDIGRNIDATITDIRGMLGTQGAERLPAALSATLEQVAVILGELQRGGAAQKLNDTLDAAQGAAQGIASASNRLPEITERLDLLLAEARGMVNAYGARSDFNAQLVGTLRELQRATQSISSVARMIERNPRAFILGR
ncbi:PqiB family protein [Paenirhodobacter populi]|uniref:PqiB family protein n=1 Tax=Paenirhodobacter populi TaxID=2306993 RepID=UPI0013E37815|nr:MlaD family protein [Sinirhodobacter populi]